MLKKESSFIVKIDKEIDNPKNYYENIEFKFKESTKKLWNKYAEKTVNELK